MEKKDNMFIQNFARLTSYDGGGRVKVVRNDAGEETGFEVRGTLTTFGRVNENDMYFTPESYDRFVSEYYEANRLNVPLVIYHNDTDPRFVCGIVKSMTKTEKGVEMVGFVHRSAYFYNLIKAQIEDGILQGFSNCGFVVDGEYDKERNALKINEFALMHASLVVNPADTTAKLQVENTAFSGFGEKEDAKVENKKEEKKEDNGWDMVV